MGCGISSPAAQPDGGQSNGVVSRHHAHNRPSVHKQLLACFSRSIGQPNHSLQHSSSQTQSHTVQLPFRPSASKSSQCSTGGLLWINTSHAENLLPRQINRLYELQFEAVGHRCVATQSDFQPFDVFSRKVAEAMQQISHTLIDLPGWQVDDPISPTTEQYEETRWIPSVKSSAVKSPFGLLVPPTNATGSRRSSVASSHSERRLSRCPRLTTSIATTAATTTEKLSVPNGNQSKLTGNSASDIHLLPTCHVATTSTVQRTKHSTYTQTHLELGNKTSQTCLSVAHIKTSQLLLQLASKPTYRMEVEKEGNNKEHSNGRKWVYPNAETYRLSSKQRLCWKHRRHRRRQSEPFLNQVETSGEVSGDCTSSHRLTRQPFSDPITWQSHSPAPKSKSSIYSASPSSPFSVRYLGSPPSLESFKQSNLPCISIDWPTSPSSSSSSSLASNSTSGFTAVVPVQTNLIQPDTAIATTTSSFAKFKPNVPESTSAEQFDSVQRPTMGPGPQPLRPKWSTEMIHPNVTGAMRSSEKLAKPMHQARQRLLQRNDQPRAHSADSCDQDEVLELKSINCACLGLALSADLIQPAPASSREQRLLQDYLKNVLLKVHSEQAAHQKVKRRHASIQTVNDMLTDEAPEYAARCPSLRKKELFYLPNLFTEIDERAIQTRMTHFNSSPVQEARVLCVAQKGEVHVPLCDFVINCAPDIPTVLAHTHT